MARRRGCAGCHRDRTDRFAALWVEGRALTADKVIGRSAASAPAVDGLVPVRESSGDLAGTVRLVAPDDGYYHEGPQDYEWRLRPGR